MTTRRVLHVANFSRTPGPRYKYEGPKSAEEFHETMLDKEFENAMKDDCVLVLNLDGTAGYGTSFIEETFGGLSRKYGIANVLKHIDIVYTEDELTLSDAWEYAKNPQPKRMK